MPGFPDGLGPLPPGAAAGLVQGQQAVQLAKPMNDVQLIALIAAEMYAARSTAGVDEILDLATQFVAGAYARVANGQFQKALNEADAASKFDLAQQTA